jgi:hypothetical protein
VGGRGGVIGCSPFLPNVIEGLPSPFGEGTLKKIVLRGFRGLFCVGKIPMHCSQVSTRRPRFRVSHMRVSTFWGQELCQILAITCVMVEL